MRAVVFAGPTLPPSRAPEVPGLVWRPPVRQGDLYKAALSRPALIGVVDGTFEVVPTVWHKEILWAMSQGIHVYGAGSIGALRAAELADFGMIGIGAVYEAYHCGDLDADDEVAVLHGPQELDYVPVTQAMVNIRATLDAAVACGVAEPAVAAALIGIAKALFYKERTYEAVMDAGSEQGLPREALHRLAAWLPDGRVDRKRQDAFAMVRAMGEHLARGVAPLAVTYSFAPTFAWEEARRRAEAELATLTT